MRRIFPDQKATNQLFNQDDDRATKQDIVDLSNQIEAVNEKVDSTQAELDAYKATIQTSVNTENITADSANIDEITSENVDTDNIDADTAAIESLHTTGITTNGITSNTATLSNATITDLQGTNANIGEVDTATLKATNAEIDNLTVNTTNLTNVVAMQGVTTSDLTATGNTTVKDVTAEDISADNLTLTEKITSEEGEIDDLITEEHKVENIVWNGKQTMAGLPNTFYVEVPHFENGVYAFQIIQNGVAKAAVEIHNSIDNYFVRWSQEDSGWVTRIIKSGNGHASVLIFEVNNLTGAGSVLVYGTASGTENVPGTNMTTSLTKPIVVNYMVPYKDGNKFFRNVDLANQGVTVGSLNKSTSSMHSLATKNYIYDTTEPVYDVDYLPDQSVNTTDDVKFRTVDSSFLNVAELEVATKFVSPHMIDGNVPLSNVDDGSIYFPTPTEEVNAGKASTIGQFGSSGTFAGDIGGFPHGLASNIDNAVSGVYIEDTTYKPQDGYDYNRSTPLYTCYPVYHGEYENYVNVPGKITDSSLAPTPLEHFAIIRKVSNGTYWVVQTRGMTSEPHLITPINRVSIENDGKISLSDTGSTWFYTDSALDHLTYNFQNEPTTGQYIWDVYGDQYQVLYTCVWFYTYGDVIYDKVLGSETGPKRVKTVNSTKELYPLIPYQEVSTQANPVDDTHPIVYDTTHDVLKKSTGDITIDNDLSVGNDLSVTGDTSITGDASVTGDLSVNGDTTLKDTTVDKLVVNDDAVIHGDLYVDGTTHTTTEEQINTTADMFVLRQNNNTSLGSSYAGVVVHKYNGTEDLAMVTDADGTMRVGTGTGTNTTYANIYWDDDTEKWYSDAALTTEVTPTGTLTSWESLEHLGDVKHYTNAVFTQITFNGIVPLLARDEEANMSNRGILNWDSTTLQAKTIAAPTADGQVLVNKAGSGITPHYEWEDIVTPIENQIAAIPHTFVFTTYNDYVAAASTVPNGSEVIILNETDYIIGDVIS